AESDEPRPADNTSAAAPAMEATGGVANDAVCLIDSTLNAEVHRICLVEGGYPSDWPVHDRCPCCGIGQLNRLFTKYNFDHSQCSECGFVCLNPYPPDRILKTLYSGSYYTNFREYYEAGYLREIGGHNITAAPLELIEEMIGRAVHARERGDWLDVG